MQSKALIIGRVANELVEVNICAAYLKEGGSSWILPRPCPEVVREGGRGSECQTTQLAGEPDVRTLITVANVRTEHSLNLWICGARARILRTIPFVPNDVGFLGIGSTIMHKTHSGMYICM